MKYREDYSCTDSDDSRTSKSSDSDENDEDWVEEKTEKEKGLAVICPVNSLLRTALDYRTYRIQRKDKDYTKGDARRMQRWITESEGEMRSRMF